MPENDETTLTEKPDKPPISEAKLQANRRNGRLATRPDHRSREAPLQP